MSSESKVPEDAPAAAATGGAGVAAATPPSIDVVVVHPLVLLSVTDHYHRVAKDTRKRVVGVLLGEVYKGRGELRTGGGRGDVQFVGGIPAGQFLARGKACRLWEGEGENTI